MTSTTKLWLAAFVSVVFATGALAGVLVERHWQPPTPDESPTGPPPVAGPGPRGRGPALTPAQAAEINLNRLDRALAFTPEQRTKVGEILQRRDERIRQLQNQAREQFITEQRALQQELEAVLTPEQRERFQSLRGRLLGPPGGRGPFGRGDGRGGRRGRE